MSTNDQLIQSNLVPPIQLIKFLDNIRNYTRTVYERKLQNVSDKFPNAKIVFMVKDPRAFIATRLRRARSKIHRRRQYFELMEL